MSEITPELPAWIPVQERRSPELINFAVVLDGVVQRAMQVDVDFASLIVENPTWIRTASLLPTGSTWDGTAFQLPEEPVIP